MRKEILEITEEVSIGKGIILEKGDRIEVIREEGPSITLDGIFLITERGKADKIEPNLYFGDKEYTDFDGHKYIANNYMDFRVSGIKKLKPLSSINRGSLVLESNNYKYILDKFTYYRIK